MSVGWPSSITACLWLQEHWPVMLPAGDTCISTFPRGCGPDVSRDLKMNVTSLEKHGTIEFRHPRFSTCIDEVGASNTGDQPCCIPHIWGKAMGNNWVDPSMLACCIMQARDTVCQCRPACRSAASLLFTCTWPPWHTQPAHLSLRYCWAVPQGWDGSSSCRLPPWLGLSCGWHYAYIRSAAQLYKKFSRPCHKPQQNLQRIYQHLALLTKWYSRCIRMPIRHWSSWPTCLRSLSLAAGHQQ
jgi:hypothetical protein